MKNYVKPPLVVLALLLVSSPVMAEGSRFTMSPSGDGFMRLDTQTGAVSICDKNSGVWQCKSLAQDGNDMAVSGQISKLEQQVRDLKSENKKLEEEIFKLAKNGSSIKTSKQLELPTEEDVDKVMSFMERMIDRFKSLGKKLKEEHGDKLGTPL